ncbi:hypothetical protein BY458DRAFT_533719 [Sporodiniella umbellata]|nr:hypothetical protein BY458DRAFT_533719 [Sporodiniella umbellata]
MAEDKRLVWTFDNVQKWLITNGWSSLVPIFSEHSIQHNQFLNLNNETLENLLLNTNTTHSERQRLLLAIHQVRMDQEPSLPRINIPACNKRKPDLSPIRTTSPNSYFNIKQYIPKRTSSSESSVSKIIEAFQPHMRPTKSKNLINPRISANDPEILSKLLGKRVPIQYALTHDRRIQVTMDADMFIRLWIKESSDALAIKQGILQKLSIDVDPSYFLYYHENGIQSTVPLTEDDLVRTCQASDDNQPNRILVVPIEGYQLVGQQKYAYNEPNVIRYTLQSGSPASTITGYQLSDPETPPTRSLPTNNEPWSSSETFVLNNTHCSSSPWNYPDQGILLYDPPTPRDRPECATSFPAEPLSPIGSHKSTEFGERPSIEKLYSDIDRYLPGHDLDQEILIENSTPRRLLGHKPSVRVVAKEAHRRWRTQHTALLRRKSTKMWGSQVERVKPGEESTIVASDRPVPTKMQWLRGELIGRGSFGRVYHALNVATGEWIAVKQVEVAVTESDRRNEDLKEAADALYREISLLKDLEHNNIVQYMGYDFNSDEGLIYIFLEYIPGGSIAGLLNLQSTFSEPQAAFFTRQILQGLEYLHEKNILHRDIKAGNVLIDQNGVCKITDFGLSKNQNDNAYDPTSNNSTMKGTVFWMAPEVLTNNYSAKVDVW